MPWEGVMPIKTDDPQVEAKRQELFERIKKMDDLMLTVLKNHIGLEQFMSEFLDASGKKPEDLTFYDKAKACEELKPLEVEAPIWKIVYAANELRNKIAHTFDHAKIKTKVDALRAAYLAALTPLQAKAAEKLDETRMASGAMETVRRIFGSRD